MPTDKMFRCSSLPLALICPGSVHPEDGEVRVDPVNAAADVGTAVHYGLKQLAEGYCADESLESTLERFPAVDVDELRQLFWAGVRMWREISEWMPTPCTEVALDFGHLTGHVDADQVVCRRIDVLDWKSGRKDIDYHHQGFGYAWLEFQDVSDCSVISGWSGSGGSICPVDEVCVHFAWLRTGELESYTVSRKRAEEWYRDEVEAKLVNWDGVYHPGDHCVHCDRNHACPAQTALVRRDVAMFHDGPEHDLQTMDGPTFAEMHRKLKGLVSRAEVALKAMRAEVSRRGGDIDAGDGSHIFLAKEPGQRKVDTWSAWPILSQHLTDKELAGAVRVSMADVDKAVAAKAGKGKAAAAKRALAEELENAGALSQPTIEKLRDERKKD